MEQRRDGGAVLVAGRYRLVERVPSADGEAWRAEDPVLGRPVTVVFRAAGGPPAGAHPPHVVDAGVEGDRAFLVMVTPVPHDTRVMPQPVEPVRPAPPAPGRRSGRVLPAVTGCLVVAAVASVVFVLVSNGDPSVPAATPTAAVQEDGSPDADPARPEASTPSAAETPARTGPADALLALQQHLDGLEARGELDGRVADRVRKDLVDIAEALADDDGNKVRDELRDVRKRLDKAARKGDAKPDRETRRLLEALRDSF